jgi:O-antigen/teichoic acid export membrane protein
MRVSKKKASLTRDTVTGMFWVAFGRAGRAILQILVLAILARLLTPADFGVVSAGLVVIGFSAIFSQLGFGPALVQRPDLEQRHIQAAFTASVLFGLLVGGLIWLGAPLAADFFRIPRVAPVLRVLAWTFPLKGLGTVSESLLQRDLRFRWLANREVASYGLGYGLVGVVLAWSGAGVWALVGANMAQAGLNTGLLILARPPSVSLRIERAAFRDLAIFGGGFTAAKIGNYVALQGDNLVVGRWLGPAALGAYGRAYQLMAMPAALFADVLDTALFPAMAKVQDDAQRLTTAYRRGVSLVALVMLPASALSFVLAPELVYLLLGPRWSSAVAPFQVLALGMLFRSSYKMSDSICRATGAVYRRAWRQGVYGLLVVGGAWVGQHWGLSAVAWGVLGALIINFLLMAQLSLSVSGMNWGSFFKAHAAALRLALASGGSAWIVVSVLRHWEIPTPVRGLCAAVAALACMLLVLWRMPALFLGSDGLWMLDVLRGYLPPRFQPYLIRAVRPMARESAAPRGADVDVA